MSDLLDRVKELLFLLQSLINVYNPKYRQIEKSLITTLPGSLSIEICLTRGFYTQRLVLELTHTTITLLPLPRSSEQL